MTFEVVGNYTRMVGNLHRKNFGQYFTESRVAEFMIQWVAAGNPSSIYDPAFGLGAFYDAAKALGFHGDFMGAEIDQIILSFFQNKTNAFKLSIEQTDYLSLWGRTHNAIVCNPPYMRFQKFKGREKVFEDFQSNLGIKLSGYTNIASAFLVKSIHELSFGGRLAYIMPLEFLNTGYGTIVKELLIKDGGLRTIIKLDCERDVFPEVTTSIGIILFEKRKSSAPTKFFVVKNLSELGQLIEKESVSPISQSNLSPKEKWLMRFEKNTSININHLVPISEYGSFVRGIATGANEFFTLSKKQIGSLQLLKDEVVPCITKSAQIRGTIFKEVDFEKLVEIDTPVFLLNLNGKLSNKANEYIAYGKSMGYDKRYLTKCRTPWYKIEKREPSPLWFGVFSREGFKVIRNYTNALNLTCYHGFRPNIFGIRFVDHLLLFFLSLAGRTILSQNMRKYGDSLNKFEPNDLNCAMCPNAAWFENISNEVVKREVTYLRDQGKLSEDAQSLFSNLIGDS
jgi:adenine-specific DNA-methyltransferase